jgi:hypothetical protein
VIRVQTVDTIEHITEFASSADHALSLQKFQELDVPLTITPTKPGKNHYNDAPVKSVFEDDIDSTTEVDSGFAKYDTRWKFRGPWLAGQSEGEFVHYLKKDIRQRRTEFRDFLRAKCAAALTRDARLNDAAEGETTTVIRTEDVTEHQLNDYIKRARKDRKELYTHIHEFLDLAPISDKDGSSITQELDKYLHDILSTPSTPSVFESQLKDLPTSQSPYQQGGPLKTHPSAGLSYSRSAARTFNHPEFGPQAQKSPVQSRIILPKIGFRTQPALGVGGFVTDVPNENATASGFRNQQTRSMPGLNGIEPEKVGGSKTWVQPKSAHIDAQGKVQLVVDLGSDAAVAVKEGKTDNLRKDNYRRPAGGFQLPHSRSSGPISPRPRSSSYGLESVSELEGLLSSSR